MQEDGAKRPPAHLGLDVIAEPEPEDATGTDDQATPDQGDEQEKSDAGD